MYSSKCNEKKNNDHIGVSSITCVCQYTIHNQAILQEHIHIRIGGMEIFRKKNKRLQYLYHDRE